MARGWESKDIESQIEQRQSGRKDLSPPPSENERRRQALTSSLTAARNGLERASHPRHRAQIEAAIAHLEAELERLREPDART